MDIHTGAILSVDLEKLREYKMKKAHTNKVNRAVDKLRVLEGDVAEIKTTLKLILEKLGA